jgi:hypothetical protein
MKLLTILITNCWGVTPCPRVATCCDHTVAVIHERTQIITYLTHAKPLLHPPFSFLTLLVYAQTLKAIQRPTIQHTVAVYDIKARLIGNPQKLLWGIKVTAKQLTPRAPKKKH